jgi:hypothetical protein
MKLIFFVDGEGEAFLFNILLFDQLLSGLLLFLLPFMLKFLEEFKEPL